MTKKIILAVIAVFITWTALDFGIHGILLKGDYEATAALWRPMEEMKMGLMYLVTALTAIIFVLIYAWLVSPKNLTNGLRFGALYGLAVGIGAGYGSYSFMPITYKIANYWFLGMLVEAIVAGIIVALIVKD